MSFRKYFHKPQAKYTNSMEETPSQYFVWTTFLRIFTKKLTKELKSCTSARITMVTPFHNQNSHPHAAGATTEFDIKSSLRWKKRFSQTNIEPFILASIEFTALTVLRKAKNSFFSNHSKLRTFKKAENPPSNRVNEEG